MESIWMPTSLSYQFEFPFSKRNANAKKHPTSGRQRTVNEKRGFLRQTLAPLRSRWSYFGSLSLPHSHVETDSIISDSSAHQLCSSVPNTTSLWKPKESSQLSLLQSSDMSSPLSKAQYQAMLCETAIEYKQIEPPNHNINSYSGYYSQFNISFDQPTKTYTDEELQARLAAVAEKSKMDVMEVEQAMGDDDEQSALLAVRKTPLTDTDRRRVCSYLDGPSTEEVLILKFNIDMTRSKFVCLRSRTWLNDEVINFYMSMLQERDDLLSQKMPNRLRSHYFNSFFMTKLQENGKYSYAQVRRWSRRFDVFSLEKVFIPINISNSHWTLAVVYIQRKEIHFYDSMAGSGASYLRDLKQWVADEHQDKKGKPLDVSSWKLVSRESHVPQQQNGYDCGVFSIVCADYLSDDLPLDYSQQDMPDFRLRIGLHILNGSLPYPI